MKYLLRVAELATTQTPLWIVAFPSITIGQSLKFIKNLDLFACFKESEKLITFYFRPFPFLVHPSNFFLKSVMQGLGP